MYTLHIICSRLHNTCCSIHDAYNDTIRCLVTNKKDGKKEKENSFHLFNWRLDERERGHTFFEDSINNTLQSCGDSITCFATYRHCYITMGLAKELELSRI